MNNGPNILLIIALVVAVSGSLLSIIFSSVFAYMFYRLNALVSRLAASSYIVMQDAATVESIIDQTMKDDSNNLTLSQYLDRIYSEYKNMSSSVSNAHKISRIINRLVSYRALRYFLLSDRSIRMVDKIDDRIVDIETTMRKISDIFRNTLEKMEPKEK